MKGMMLAAAVLALTMGGSRMAWLSARYRKAAKEYASKEVLARQVRRLDVENDKSQDELARLLGRKPSVEEAEARAASAREFQHTIDHFADLRRKYERAAARPWLAVDAEPSPTVP